MFVDCSKDLSVEAAGLGIADSMAMLSAIMR
jgi:hypothetical protein